MAGFRDFQTGEVLTAANVNDFLAKQSVMKFADAAARDTALGTAVGGGNALREGMVAYLDDTNEVLAYDGTAWAGVGGGLVDVKYAVKTDTYSASLASQASSGVTGLTIAHAASDASNTIYLIALVNGSQTFDSAVQRQPVAAALTAGGTQLAIGDTASNRTRVGASNSSFGDNALVSVTLVAQHSPASTSSVTYGVDLINMATASQTVYLNRSSNDTDAAYTGRAASVLMLMEVKV